MSTVLKFYFYSVAGACAYIVLFDLIFKNRFRKSAELRNHPDIKIPQAWADTPAYVKLVTIFIPVLNFIFSLFAILLVIKQLLSWYRSLGSWYIFKATRSMKHFAFKQWIVYRLWPGQEDYFSALCDIQFSKDMKEIVKVFKDYKAKKDEKEKSESKQAAHAEPDCKNPEASTKGSDDNPAAGA